MEESTNSPFYPLFFWPVSFSHTVLSFVDPQCHQRGSMLIKYHPPINTFYDIWKCHVINKLFWILRRPEHNFNKKTLLSTKLKSGPIKIKQWFKKSSTRLKKMKESTNPHSNSNNNLSYRSTGFCLADNFN